MGEKIFNGFLFLLSIAYLSVAQGLAFGSFQAPKAGFMPQLVGWLAVIVSGYLFLQALRGKGDAKNVKLDLDWKRLFLLVGVMVLYVLMIKSVGYLLCSILALFATFKIAKVKGWVVPGVISVVASGAFYFIFRVLLSISLPVGILG
jgi:putative tricarboxylic transport membrane protein